MRILLDTCVWGGVLDQLVAAGHDVLWVGNFDEDPGDEEILKKADRDHRTLITLDKDFGELAIVRGMPHAGIIRLVSLSSAQQSTVSIQVLSKYEKDLEAGAIVTAGIDRIRIRLPEK